MILPNGYTVSCESCGWPTPEFFVRLRGVEVSRHKYEKDAATAAWNHHGAQMHDMRTSVPAPLGMERAA